MTQPQERQTTERYETEDPRNPPNSVTNRTVRREALGSFVGPLVALALVLGLVLLYWTWRSPDSSGRDHPLNPAVGTAGEQPPVGQPSPYPAAGGGDPAPRPDSTRDELKYRGGN